MCWPLLCLRRLICFVERCLNSNPESRRSKLGRYQFSYPSPKEDSLSYELQESAFASVTTTEYIEGLVEIWGVYLPSQLEHTVHHNFVGVGRYSESGWACSGAPPPSPWPNFSIMMECTPKSGHCHSVYSVVSTVSRGHPFQVSLPPPLTHHNFYATVL